MYFTEEQKRKIEEKLLKRFSNLSDWKNETIKSYKSTNGSTVYGHLKIIFLLSKYPRFEIIYEKTTHAENKFTLSINQTMYWDIVHPELQKKCLEAIEKNSKRHFSVIMDAIDKRYAAMQQEPWLKKTYDNPVCCGGRCCASDESS